MTTKFLDNKNFKFKILLSWRFPRKQAFLDDFPICPQGPPPSKANILFLLSSRRKFRERKLNTNLFFSNFSGTSGISRQNPGISRQKSLVSLVSIDIPNFLAPTQARGRPPPHRKISGPKSLGLGSFFVPENCFQNVSQKFKRIRRFLKFVYRRPPDYSSNLCPPRIFAI